MPKENRRHSRTLLCYGVVRGNVTNERKYAVIYESYTRLFYARDDAESFILARFDPTRIQSRRTRVIVKRAKIENVVSLACFSLINDVRRAKYSSIRTKDPAEDPLTEGENNPRRCYRASSEAKTTARTASIADQRLVFMSVGIQSA